MRYFGADPVLSPDAEKIRFQVTNAMNGFRSRIKTAWFSLAEATADFKAGEFEVLSKTSLYEDLWRYISTELARLVGGTGAMTGYMVLRYCGLEPALFKYTPGVNKYQPIPEATGTKEQFSTWLSNNYSTAIFKGVYSFKALYESFTKAGFNFGELLYPFLEKIISARLSLEDATFRKNKNSSIQQSNNLELSSLKSEVTAFKNQFTKYEAQYGDIGLKSYDQLVEEVKTVPAVVEAPAPVKDALAEVAPIVTTPEKKSYTGLILTGLAVAGVVLGAKRR